MLYIQFIKNAKYYVKLNFMYENFSIKCQKSDTFEVFLERIFPLQFRIKR